MTRAQSGTTPEILLEPGKQLDEAVAILHGDKWDEQGGWLYGKTLRHGSGPRQYSQRVSTALGLLDELKTKYSIHRMPAGARGPFGGTVPRYAVCITESCVGRGETLPHAICRAYVRWMQDKAV